MNDTHVPSRESRNRIERLRVMKARLIELLIIALNKKHEHREFSVGQMVAIYETAELIGWKELEALASHYIDAVEAFNSKNYKA